MLYIPVKNISCDRCSYYDVEEKFPDIYTSAGREVLKKFGWDLSNDSHRGHIQTFYSGAICPECGNFSQLDFNPGNNLEELLSPM